MKILILVALEKEFKLKFNQYFKDSNYKLVYTGVGLINATMITTKYILLYKPDLIINYGSAGNLKNHTGLKNVKQVYIIDKSILPDKYDIKDSYLSYDNKNNEIIVGSSIKFITKPDIWTKENCDLVDMELYGIACACNYFNVPWISRKWVSDNADINSINNWESTLPEGKEMFLNFLTNTNITKLIV